MNKNTPRHTPLLVALALTLSSSPLPAVAAVITRVQIAPSGAGVRAIAVSPISGSNLSMTPSSPLQLGTSLVTTSHSPSVTPSLTPSASAGQVTVTQTAAALPSETPKTPIATPTLAPDSKHAPVAPLVSPSTQEDETPAASKQGRGLVATIKSVLSGKLSFGKLFENSRMSAPAGMMGILPTKRPTLPQGMEDVILDDAPTSPAAGQVSGGVTLNAFDIPGARSAGGIFDGPTVLQADPSSEADVERALRAAVDADPVRFGVGSSELSTVHVKRIEGTGNQADTFFAYFRQVKDGIPMHGSYLSFTVKVLQGRPVVMGAMANLYPGTNVATQAAFSEEELQGKIWERLGTPPQAGLELVFLERKIIYSKGAWHTANLYIIEGFPVMIAVDVASGEAFAWDPRMGLTAGSAGKVTANKVDKGATKPNSKLVEVPLANLEIKIGNKTVFTDRDGNIPVSVTEETQVTVKLDGRYAVVNNKSGSPLTITATLKPGVQTKLVFNKETALDEVTIAQIQAYYLVNYAHDWLADNKIADKRLDQKLPINVNIDDECNAYYTPGRPSENYFNSSENCVNSAYDTVVSHEHGHFVDDMLGGIVDGGLSEGWGDILSMYQLNNPIIGEGFLKKPRGGVDYIRHGENTHQYNANDEAHDAGEVWGGFAWKLRKALIASLGEAGDAVARSIVLPTLYAKAANIPAAIAQVLLNDMDKDGNIPHEKEIRAAAKVHGITLPKNPGLFDRFVAWLSNPRQWFA